MTSLCQTATFDEAVKPTVFAVIPVFNRLHFTRECIRRLQAQTYPSLVVIVSDGGSTDGTPIAIQSEFPDVVVLTSREELWWAGSTRLGIDYALEHSSNAADFALMLNNDTVIPESYVATLVQASLAHHAAVGALIVDSRDPSRVLDAGEYVHWSTYQFPVKTAIAPEETYCSDVDVLPGRGSLIPLSMIRRAGNVDADRFPHYLADYEFFYRLKRHGFALGVCYETHVLAHIDETGLVPSAGVVGFARVWRELFSRRSMGNVVDHWRFVARHSPPAYRNKLKLRLAARTGFHLGLRTPLRPLALPLYWIALSPFIVGRLMSSEIKAFRQLGTDRRERGRDTWCYPERLPRLIRLMGYLLHSPAPVHADDCNRQGVEPEQLVQAGVLRPLRADGWFAFTTFEVPNGPQLSMLSEALTLRSKLRGLVSLRRAQRDHASRAG